MLSEANRSLLRQKALDSINHGVETGQVPAIVPYDYAAELQVLSATFVTLHRHRQLRGCMGVLQPMRPLIEDIVHNAWSAAFRDPRFTPLQADEVQGLDIHISILAQPEVIKHRDEQDLIEQLRPGVDGLILEEGMNRGTFLPSVWEALPDAADFVRQLKVKAGLAQDYWSDSLQVQRYTVEAF